MKVWLAAAVLFSALPAAAELPALEAGRWAELETVNRAMFRLPAVRDRVRFAVDDYWEAADSNGGDCEDKALAARAALLAQGWPADSLRLALVRTEASELHAVLTVEVLRNGQAATYVLDSRYPWVLAWDALAQNGYQWLIRQDGEGQWRKVVKP